MLLVACALAACGDGGRASLATPKLAYNGSMPFPAVIGEAIVLTPAVSGTLGQYRVSPALPAGLSIDERSGVISGTPTEASGLAPYTVTANSLAGNTRFILLLTVKPAPSGAIARHEPARWGPGRGRVQPVPSQNLPAGETESSGNIHAGDVRPHD